MREIPSFFRVHSNLNSCLRKTNKKFSAPVGLFWTEKKVILVPMQSSDNDWFKDLVKDPEIQLCVQDITIPFKGTLARDPDQAKTAIDGLNEIQVNVV